MPENSDAVQRFDIAEYVRFAIAHEETSWRPPNDKRMTIDTQKTVMLRRGHRAASPDRLLDRTRCAFPFPLLCMLPCHATRLERPDY